MVVLLGTPYQVINLGSSLRLTRAPIYLLLASTNPHLLIRSATCKAAFTMLTYPVHLQRLPSIALLTSSSVGLGFLPRK